MVINIKRALVSNRLMKSLTGLSAEEFLKLVPTFQAAFFEIKNEKYEREKANRQRKPGSGPKGLLASAGEKLFFILLYLKCYPTVDVLAFFYDKRIGFLGKTTQGKEHDFSMLKSEDVLMHIPKDVLVHCDLGFQGIGKEFPDVQSVLPQKKPRGKELLADEKEQNKAKSRVRILVENALAGVKRLRIVSDIYRNRVEDFDDLVMPIGSGLWNYHLA